MFDNYVVWPQNIAEELGFFSLLSCTVFLHVLEKSSLDVRSDPVLVIAEILFAQLSACRKIGC